MNAKTTTRATDMIREFYDKNHETTERSRAAYRYFYSYLTRVIRMRVPEGLRVLEIGCGSGDLLAGLEPSLGVGIDLSGRAVDAARERHGDDSRLQFRQGDGADPELLKSLPGPFDVVLLVSVAAQLEDVQQTIENLHVVCHPRTRLLIYGYSRLWQPLFWVAERLRLKHRPPSEGWLPPEEVRNMLELADFEVVRNDAQIVFPFAVPLLANAANRYLGHVPGAAALSLMYGIVARPSPRRLVSGDAASPSVSVIIPCRNESGHIRPLVERLPDLGPGSEFLFVEGNSSDDTEAEIRRVIAAHPGRPLRLLKQPGKGKGDAVRLGFDEAKGDIVLILDSDMGVAPEDIPKFVRILARGQAEMANGSRMVYPMEGQAMRFLNLLANKTFALTFSWLLGQQVRDTLCGTKALYRADYQRIANARAYFGDFDPFGDFDLLFGAARLNLRIRDVVVRYHAREYGATNISRFRHGLVLLRMTIFAARKLKFL